MFADSIPSRECLRVRGGVLRACREFFWSAGFIEVETPVRVAAPAPELHIDAPRSGAYWLRTSPELHMKRLLAAGHTRIFQIGPCFREGERGLRHNPEFTMLEWYRAQADYRDILRDTQELLRHVVRRITGADRIACGAGAVDVSPPWHVFTVREAFLTYAGWDPVAAYDADRFDLDLVNCVEPALPRDRPCVLTNYPAAAAALARLKPDDPSVAERWEVYIRGLELANAYSELTDAVIQRERFMACNAARRAAGREAYPLDEAFLAALPRLPPCGGIALGVDRLAMLLANVGDIGEVRVAGRSVE